MYKYIIMHKRIQALIDNLKELFLLEKINKLAYESGFIKRKGKLSAEDFASLCIFKGEDLCETDLSSLCSRIHSKYKSYISSEALNKRFNSNSVAFMSSIFYEMLKVQNKILRYNQNFFKTNFNRIRICDSTAFKLPEEYNKTYKGSGGSGTKSSIKIQLEYDLLTGEFIHCETTSGIENDVSYLNKLQENIQKDDLYLKDLGYFKITDLEFIDGNHAFFISKLKNNINIYIKNEKPDKYKNGKIIESTLYKKVDIKEVIKSLKPGKTLELPNIYIGKKKKSYRLIITKLTEENKRKKQAKHDNEVRKQLRKPNETSSLWNSVNVYITNVPAKILRTEHVHEIYSLRWQIEIMFKIWKSLFKIHLVKKVKIERFQCFLYGRLISLLLTSSLVFTSKSIIFETQDKEISEFKSFKTVKEFFDELNENIFKSKSKLIKILDSIFKSILRYGKKSKHKKRKNPNLILKNIKLTMNDIKQLAI